MVVLNFILFLVFSVTPMTPSCPVYTYCTIPCPFMNPATAPAPVPTRWAYSGVPRRSMPTSRSGFGNYDDYEDPTASEPPVPSGMTSRQQQPPNQPEEPAPKEPSPPPNKPKIQRSKSEDPEPAPEPAPQKKKSPPSTPDSSPSRRFFSSLFSIPGAVVDSLLSGEIMLS